MTVAAPAAAAPEQYGPRHHRVRSADVGGIVAGLGLLSVVIAVLVGPTPALLLLGTVVAGVLAVAAVLRPVVAMTLLVVGEFANAAQVLADHGLPGLYKGLLALGTVSVLVALRSAEVRARLRSASPLVPLGLVACYLVLEIPGIISSVSPQATSEFISDQLKDFLFFTLVLLLALLIDRPWRVAAMIVLPLAAICFLTVINQVVLGGTGSFGGFATVSTASGENITTPRYAGPLPDSNFWGRYLVLGLPFAFALAHRAHGAGRAGARFGWAVCALLILAGMYLTQSRGTLLAGCAVIVLWVIAAGPMIRRRAMRLAPVALLVMLVPGIGNRLLNLGEAFEGAPAYAIDPSLVERTAAQKIAVLIFTDHPLWGIGPGAFGSAVPDYASRSTDLLIGATRAPHNLYLELASETGIVGLAGWLVLIGGLVVLGVRAVVRLAGTSDQSGPAPTRGLAAAAFAAVVGWSIASIFLHLSYFRPVLVVFAFVATLDAAARQRPVTPDATAAARGLRLALSRSGIAACVGAVVLVTVLVGFGENRYTAGAAYTLEPARGTYESYSIDVRSRITVLPAFAAAAQGTAAGPDVKIDAEPTNGVITVTTTADTVAVASRTLRSAMALTDDGIRRLALDRGFTLLQMSPPEVTVQQVYPDHVVWGAIGIGAVLSSVVVLATERLRRRRTTRSEATA